MGNWRSVDIVGTIDPSEVQAARDFVDPGENLEKWHCLSCFRSLCGLGMWPAETITATGNLSERDYTVDDVAETLREMVKLVPSLSLKVHCGGDYEDKACIATVTAAAGEVTIGDPERETVGEGIEFQAGMNLMSILTGMPSPLEREV